MIGTVMPDGKKQFFTDSGVPLAGGKLYFYAAGTSTLQNTYTDSTLLVANANPVVLDANGRATIFLSAATYRVALKTSADVVVWDVDGISALAPFNVDLDVQGVAGEALVAGQGVYLSDGSGGKTAGRWYKADATNPYSSSDATMTGVVPADIAAAATSSIRLLGRLTGLVGLLTGSTYYATNVAGTLGVTPGTNRRAFGVADSGTVLVIGPSVRAPDIVIAVGDFVEGRLSLTTATPVTSSDVTAATTLYYTAYRGDRISLFDGTSTWNIRTCTEISIAIPATTSTVYDVFIYDNLGTPTLELLAWTNDTTRATAIARQNGRLVKSGTTTRRFVGCVRTTTVSGQTEDSAQKRWTYNYYNRKPRLVRRTDPANAWTYTIATMRQGNANVLNQIDVLQGVAESTIDVSLNIYVANSGGGLNVVAGIGEDSTTTLSANQTGQGFLTVLAAFAGINQALSARLVIVPAVGRHFYSHNEYSQAASVTTWNVADPLGLFAQRGGLIGVWES